MIKHLSKEELVQLAEQLTKTVDEKEAEIAVLKSENDELAEALGLAKIIIRDAMASANLIREANRCIDKALARRKERKG